MGMRMKVSCPGGKGLVSEEWVRVGMRIKAGGPGGKRLMSESV